MRVALVGLGYIAEHHYQAVRKVGGAELIVCDVNQASAEAFSERPGVESAVTDIEELVVLKPDVAHVLTPPDVHYAVATRLIEAGIDVLLEKPICDRSSDAQRLITQADKTCRSLATSHNFLFYRIWETLKAAIDDGRLGSLHSIDVCTRRPFSPLRANNTRPWAMRASRNILFEVAPHSFACALDIVPSIDVHHVQTSRPQDLPNGVRFFRQWDVLGVSGDVTVRFDMSFDDAYSEFFVHVRGTTGSALVDFDRNTVVVNTRSFAGGDVEVAKHGLRSASAYGRGAVGTLLATVARKVGSTTFGPPYEQSIERAVAQFTADRIQGRALDRRLAPDLAIRVVKLGEDIEAKALLPEPERPILVSGVAGVAAKCPRPDPSRPSALVIGGTGFIGTALVRRLASEGVPTRVIARQIESARRRFAEFPSVEVIQGELERTEDLMPLLAGVDVVYHLAYSPQSTWGGVLRHEVEPTMRLIDLCAAAHISRFIYASSTAIFDAGDASRTITEDTPASPGMVATEPYARAKAEIEAYLRERHRVDDFPAVIIRPAIVLGVDSDPCHWGIAAWPHPNMAVHWGSGRNKLPIVLVDDVADAFAKALDQPAIEGHCFNLSSPACITAEEYLRELSRASAISIQRRQQSAAVLYTSQVAKWLMKLPSRNWQPFPRWANCNGRSFASPFDCSTTESALDWHPETDRAALLRMGVTKPAQAWHR